MEKAIVVSENEAARTELKALVDRLDADSCAAAEGASWIVSSTLCHLAFWDQRVLCLLRRWQNAGCVDTPRLDAPSIDSINQALGVVASHVEPTAAARVALESAAAVDAFVAGLDVELMEMIQSAGFGRYLRRSLHRTEHLRKIRQTLAIRP